ncbi:hypothetical protein GXW82_27985 [Streptacidiphilus sp. 4-A2]|nr:hypothetical protein [Streptacidiphilus sp. 4-A2]
MKTTMIKTNGLTSTAATCFGAPAAALPVLGLAGGIGLSNGFSGFGGGDLSIVDLSVVGTGLFAPRDERPMSASVAAAEAAAGQGLGYAAAGAGNHRAAVKQSEQQHQMWAFRGPGPWKERT